MRWIIVCACILLSGLSLQAQIISADGPVNTSSSNYVYPQRQLFILGNLNVALPFGDYGSQDFFNPNALYARAGWHAQLNVGRIFKRFIGVTGSVGIIRHPANLNRIEDILSVQVQSQLSDFQYRGFYHYYVDGGLLVSFEASPIIEVDLRAMAGVTYGVDADLSFKFSTPTAINKAEIDKATDVGLLLNPGFTVRMRVKDRLVISGNCDYMWARYSFNDVAQKINGTQVGAASYEVVMHNLSFGLGLGITLR